MFAGKNKELQKIINLKNKGKFSKASDKLTKFIIKNHKPETNIRAQLIKAFLNANMGFWEKGLGIIEKAISESELLGDQLLIIDAFIVKANCFAWGEQYKKSNTLIEETEKLLEEKLNSEEYDNKLRKAMLILSKGHNYNSMGENKLAREMANHGLTFTKKITESEIQLNLYELLGNNEYQVAEYEQAINYYNVGLQIAKDANYSFYEWLFCFRLTEGYGVIGNVDLALKYCDLSIELRKKQNKNPMWMLAFKAQIYWSIGELEKSIKLNKESLPFFEKETSFWGRACFLRIKAYIEWREGSINQAIEYMTEAIDLVKKRDDICRSTILSVQLAPMLFDKGKFEQVLEICFANLEIIKRNKNSYFQTLVFETMGRTFHIQGDYNLALDYVQKSLKSWKRFNYTIQIAQSLFILLQISIDKNDKVLYTKYLEELEIFVKNNSTNLFEQMYQTAQALVLKASSRPRDWAKAVEILIDVVNEKITKHGHSEIALINLCELLMNEFSMSGDAQVLQELECYVEKLSKLAKKQNVYHLRLEANNLQIMTHWLKAQNSMVELDFQKAKTLLNNARQIADAKGLYRLAEKMSQQQERLLGQLSQWDDFIRKYYEFIKE